MVICLGIEIGSLPCSTSTVEFADSATHWVCSTSQCSIKNAINFSYPRPSLPASPPPHLYFPPPPCRLPSSSGSTSPAKPPLPLPSPAAQLPVSPAWDTELVGSDSTPYQYTCCWVSSTILLSFSCSSAPCVTCMGHRASGE